MDTETINDARRYQALLDDPETGRHLLSLLAQKKGTQEQFRAMQDRIACSKNARALSEQQP